MGIDLYLKPESTNAELFKKEIIKTEDFVANKGWLVHFMEFV